MALPPDLLGDLRDLEGTVAAVRDAVDAALAAGRGAGPALTAGSAVAEVEGATLAWLDRTAALEPRLRAHAEAQPGDTEDVAGRLGGLAVLHVAAAGDVGAVAALDRGDDRGDVRSLAAGAGWPAYTSAIQATAFDAGLVRALGDPDPSGPD